MHRYLTAVAAAVLAVAAAAQQPQQCVNPQLLNGLVFLGRSELKVSVTRGHAAFMGGVRLPTDLNLIGTGVRQGGITTVAYRTALSSEKAFAAAVAALGTQGWTTEATPGSAATFRVASGPKEGTLCRDAERRYVMVTEGADARYVNIMASPEPRRRECNADPFMADAMALARGSAPRFQFPEGTSLGQFGGGGGSNSLYTNASRIISSDTPARLAEHLATQLQAQGWQADADWSASGGAGSTWRKTHDGELTWGTLEIIRVSEDTYDVDFTLALAQ